jgi:hypothetical protein
LRIDDNTCAQTGDSCALTEEFDPTVDFACALFAGRVAYSSSTIRQSFVSNATDLIAVPAFLKLDLCWIAAVDGDPGKLEDLTYANNDTKAQIARLTLEQYDRTIKQFKLTAIDIKVILSLLTRLGLTNQFKQIARQRVKQIYNGENQ